MDKLDKIYWGMIGCALGKGSVHGINLMFNNHSNEN